MCSNGVLKIQVEEEEELKIQDEEEEEGLQTQK